MAPGRQRKLHAPLPPLVAHGFLVMYLAAAVMWLQVGNGTFVVTPLGC